MQVKVERGVLLAGLQRVQGVVEKRNTMPVLSNVLIEAQDGRLRLFATDLEIGVKGAYPAQVEAEGAVSLSARKLFDIVRELPDSMIQMTSSENFWVDISAASSKFRMVGLAPEEFPPVPSPEKEVLLAVGRNHLLEGIEKVAFSVGDNDARYILNGLYMNLKQPAKGRPYVVRLVGTDGHRLAMIERETQGEPAKSSGPSEHQLVISKKAIMEIKRLLEEDEAEPVIGLSENQLVMKKGDVLLMARLMEGTYPNYEQVIPKNNPKKVSVQKKAMEGALKRVSIFAREKTHAIRVTLLPNRLNLLSNSPDVGEAQEDIPAAYGGEELAAGFNARYLMDALSVMDSETVWLHFKDAFSPCLMTDESDPKFLCVVMPMRI